MQQLTRACEERTEAKRLQRELEALRQQSNAYHNEFEHAHAELQVRLLYPTTVLNDK